MTSPRPLCVRDLVERQPTLGLRFHAHNAGLDRQVSVSAVLRPAVLLTGRDAAEPGSAVVLGAADVEWLVVRPLAEQIALLAQHVNADTPFVVVCQGIFPPKSVTELSASLGLPLLTSRRSAGAVAADLHRQLAQRLAEQELVHGELLQVHNLGVLIIGDSGIGKSEAALELVLRGHRLVADDVVDVQRGGPALLGAGREGLGHYLEVRGLGILHAADLFGQAAVMEKTAIHLVVEMVEWGHVEVDRTGLDELSWTAVGVSIPRVQLPVRPGRNIALLIEVAARNQILKRRGIHSARRLADELDRRLRAESSPVTSDCLDRPGPGQDSD